LGANAKGDVKMPAQDRTGPRGQGPRTGWGRGLCGAQDRGMGRGRGRGWGPGRGFGRRWGAEDVEPAPVSDNVEELRAESSRLKAELDAVEDRLSRLDEQD
jgi:hypothetical protein